MMNLNPTPTCVWKVPIDEPPTARSLTFSSSTTRSARYASNSAVSAPPHKKASRLESVAPS